jgi:hypothetical protein
MKNHLYILLVFLCPLFVNTLKSQVLISNTTGVPHGTAMLEVKSTAKGFLPPRMTEAQRDAINNPTAGLIIFCSDCLEMQMYNGTAWTNMIGLPVSSPIIPPALGDNLFDGVVFYIFQPGDCGYVVGETHGLVVSLDEGDGGWGCDGTDLGAVANVTYNSTDPETQVGARICEGEYNTDGIVQDCPIGYAADWCRDKGPEWYLPSRGELNELFKWYELDFHGNNMLMVNYGGVWFAVDYYWSSTEGPNFSRWFQDFYTGNQEISSNQNDKHVRAVRAF